LKTPAL